MINYRICFGVLLFTVSIITTPSSQQILGVSADNSEESKSLAYTHFIMGTLASLDGNADLALSHFQLASRYDPKSGDLVVKQAEEQLNLGKVVEAKALLHRVEREQAKVADYQLLVARVSSQESDLDTSLKALESATHLYLKEKNPTKAREALLTKVALLADNKKYKESISALQNYLKRQPDDEISYYFLGKIHSIFQNRREAKRAYEKALSLRPNFLAAAKALGLQLELEGKVQEALVQYQDVFRTNPSDEELNQKLINLSLMNEDYPAALEYLKQYLVLRPDDLQSQMRTALIHYKLKQFEEARAIFENLLTNDMVAQDRVLFYLGTLSEEEGKFNDALHTYERVKSDSEYFVEARLQIAFIHGIKNNNSSLAISSLNAAIGMKTDSPELYLSLASEHERQNQIPEAIRVLTTANQKFNRNEKILFLLGTLLDRVGDSETAIQRMKEVLEINPNNAHALNHIGYNYAERNQRLDEAEEMLKRAAQIAPDNGFIQDSLGWVYFRMGKFQKASQFLERANKMSPKQPVILEHLADTLKAMGKTKEALAVYQQIMRWSLEDETQENAAKAAMDENKSVQNRVREKIALLDVRNSN